MIFRAFFEAKPTSFSPKCLNPTAISSKSLNYIKKKSKRSVQASAASGRNKAKLFIIVPFCVIFFFFTYIFLINREKEEKVKLFSKYTAKKQLEII